MRRGPGRYVCIVHPLAQKVKKGAGGSGLGIDGAAHAWTVFQRRFDAT